MLQAIARGEDHGPLVPVVADERFEATLALEWPIEGLEPPVQNCVAKPGAAPQRVKRVSTFAVTLAGMFASHGRPVRLRYCSPVPPLPSTFTSNFSVKSCASSLR